MSATLLSKLITERIRVAEISRVNRAVIPEVCNRVKSVHFNYLNHKLVQTHAEVSMAQFLGAFRPSLVSLNLGSMEAIYRAHPEQLVCFIYLLLKMNKL